MLIRVIYGCFLLMLISLLGCQAIKPNLVPRYEQHVKNRHLKGPVKLLRCHVDYVDPNLTYDQKNHYRANLEAGGADEFISSVAVKFDTLGRRIRRWFIDSVSQVVSDKKAGVYFYDEEDFNAKKQYLQKEYARYTYNPGALKLNQKDYSTIRLIERKDSSDLELYYKYDYVFDDFKKPLREYKIICLDKDVDGTPEVTDTTYVANYVYNDKHQLVQKKFRFIANRIRDPIRIDHNYNAYRRFKTVEKYTHNDDGLLSSVKLYYDAKVFFSEEYNYNDNDQLTKLRRIKLSEIMSMNKDVKPYKDLFFNTEGDVSKIIAYSDDFKTPFATYFYVYKDYDAYGNWTYCELHLDGEIKDTPTMIAKRIIEYYD